MILYLNSEPHGTEPTWNKADYLMAAAKKDGREVELYRGQNNPEYVLNIEPYTRVITGTKWTGVWEIDLLCDRQQLNESNWVVANTVFIAVSTLPSRMEHMRERTQILFQACDPEIHKRIPSIPQKYDFVLSGSMGHPWYEERERVVNLLQKQGYSYHDFGKGHNPREYVEMLNTARVQLIRSMKTQIGDGEVAQRFFECLAIGPVLTNYVNDLDSLHLVEGEDYFAYKSDEELLDKMKRLTQDVNLATTMAYKGRLKALSYHTYSHRLEEIFLICKGK